MKFVKKIALVNSLHKNFVDILDEETRLHFQKITVNYILSPEPEGSLLYSAAESDEYIYFYNFSLVVNRSCGTMKLELSHYFIYDDIFKNYD